MLGRRKRGRGAYPDGRNEPERPRTTQRAAHRPAQDVNLWRQIGQYTGLAFTLPAAGVIGFAIGWWLDHHFGTGEIFTIVFLLLGCAAGLIEIVRVLGKS